ncbi:uncharacterized protein [Dysidea avara]|uniref:uncharacterized protein isoform X2 n=1 Tax=Dysidea avara TaxID=196820 RepID=UPI0033345DF1
MLLIAVLLVNAFCVNGASLNVTIVSDPLTDEPWCENGIVVLSCVASDATKPVYEWLTPKSKYTGKTLNVQATTTSLDYYCNVTDTATERKGQAKITVVSNGSPPMIRRTNYEDIMPVDNGKSVSLIAELVSSLPLVNGPTWSKSDASLLPSEAVTKSFTVGNKSYSSLDISNVSFVQDYGNYSLSVSNICGKTSSFVFIDVKGPKVCPSVINSQLQFMKKCADVETIEGESVTYDCSYEADYTDFEHNVSSYWKVEIPNQQPIHVDRNSNHINYSVRVYGDCISKNKTCCKVTSSLTINNVSILQNGTKVSCIAVPVVSLLSNTKNTNASAHLAVYVHPKLTMPPKHAYAVENKTGNFKCHFNSSTKEYFTILSWSKNGTRITNALDTRYQITEGNVPGKDVMYLSLNISNVSRNDEGNYSCHCSYNKTMLNEINIIDKSYLAQGFVLLTVTTTDDDKGLQNLIVICALCTVAVILTFLIFVYTSKRQSKSCVDTETTSLGTAGIDDAGSTTDLLSVEKAKYGAMTGQQLGNFQQSYEGNIVCGVKASSTVSNVMMSFPVTVVPACPPTDPKNLFSEIEVGLFDERGGVFHSYKHGVTVVVPTGAIPIGVLAELKFAATLVAPVKVSDRVPVSPIIWLCMDVMLQKPIQIRIPHCVNTENDFHFNSLKFAKGIHLENGIKGTTMNLLSGARFSIGESYGSIEVTHFCYYCIVKDSLPPTTIISKYGVVAMTQKQPSNDCWKCDICILPFLPTCIKSAKSQYSSEWQSKTLGTLTFAPSSSQVDITIDVDQFQQHQTCIELLSENKIYQKDADFYEYYDKVDELWLRMEEDLYPPRFNIEISGNTDFFKTRKYFMVGLICDAKTRDMKLAVPSIDPLSVSSSESDVPRKQQDEGYTINDEDFQDVQDQVIPGTSLDIRQLVIHTMQVRSKWYEFGCALELPLKRLDKLSEKYYDNPVRAFIRVYHYWMSDNNLEVTVDNLLSALHTVNEYMAARNVEAVLQIKSASTSAQDSDKPDELEFIMRKIKPELVNVTELLPLLNNHGLLTLDDNYILLNHLISPIEKANVLLYSIIPSKGNEACRNFIMCLQEETSHTGHQELAKQFKIMNQQ